MVLQMVWEEVWAAVGCYEIKQVSKHVPLCCFAFIHTTNLQQERPCSRGVCHWSGFTSCTA